MGSKTPFGSTLGRFGVDLGRFWDGLGRFWVDFGRVWKNWTKLRQSSYVSLFMGSLSLLLSVAGGLLGDIFFSRDPRADSPTRLASQCAGVLRPRVKWELTWSSTCGRRSEAPLRWGSRIPSRTCTNLFGRLLGAIFLIFFALGRVLGASWAST